MIIGMDEVGMGALAGPVVVAAVAIEPGSVEGVVDSKRIRSEAKRHRLAREIEWLASWCFLATRNAGIIDRIGIRAAWRECIEECVLACKNRRDLVRMDGPRHAGLEKHFSDIGNGDFAFAPHGDDDVYEIGAASIVAKSHRDRLMRKYGRVWPHYRFAKHKGYGTSEHIKALRIHDICSIHRKTFIGKFADVRTDCERQIK